MELNYLQGLTHLSLAFFLTLFIVIITGCYSIFFNKQLLSPSSQEGRDLVCTRLFFFFFGEGGGHQPVPKWHGDLLIMNARLLSCLFLASSC